MGCVIKYKGQSIPEEQFLQYLNKQIAINNLFNENENLANTVYEALGFGQENNTEVQKADIERRRQEELDNLFSKTQASTDKQLNTPVQKLSKEEVSKNIETAKQQNKDLIEELENPEFLNDEKRNDEWDKKADELSGKLPQGVSFRITDGKVDFFDSQSYREKGFGKSIVQVSVGNLHNKTEKFEVGDNLQVHDGVRAIPAIVTKVNEHGKILEAKDEDGRIIISRGNIITLAPINDRLKINAKYDAELAALESQTTSQQKQITPEQKQQALQLYSQYLDTIFPDSKVKDIVYHYTNVDKFDKFVKTYMGSSVQRTGVNAADSQLGIFFGNKLLEGVLNKEKLGKTEIATIINISNPNTDIYDKADKYLYSSERFIDEQEPDFDIDIEEDEKGNVKTIYKEKHKPKGKDFERNWYNSYKQELISNGIDGIITDNIKIVFEPEQIHILSSKKDLEMFKNFINFTKSEYAKYGDIQQFKDYIMSKNFAAIEEFLVVNNKIDRKC